jgi:hypothetical protein
MIGNISLENNTFDLTYLELKQNYAFNIVFTILNSNSGKPSGRININIINLVTNISYPNLIFGDITVTGGPINTTPVIRLKNSSLYIGFDTGSPEIIFAISSLYNSLYNSDYTLIDNTTLSATPSATDIPDVKLRSTFYINGLQLQTNKQNYSNYISNLINTFNKNYILPNPPLNNNIWIIIGVIIGVCIIIIIILILVIIIKNN